MKKNKSSKKFKNTWILAVAILGPLGIFFGFFFSLEKISDKFFTTREIESLYTFSKSHDFTDWKEKIEFIAKTPHPFGSSEQRRLAEWIREDLRRKGALVDFQEFESPTPNPILLENPQAPADLLILKKGQNIIAKLSKPSPSKSNCYTIIGSHYDTKLIGKDPYHGANDSASSTYALIKLLELHTQFKSKQNVLSQTPSCDFLFVWFDGEEAVLQDWTSGEFEHPAKIKDNTYGSRHFVSQLKECEKNSKCLSLPGEDPKKIQSLLLLDMIGSPQIMLSKDEYSQEELWLRAREISQILSLNIRFSDRSIPIEDDHIPFVKIGIPSLNLIDFNHVMHWHKPTDTVQNLDPKSIEEVIHLSFILSLEMSRYYEGLQNFINSKK